MSTSSFEELLRRRSARGRLADRARWLFEKAYLQRPESPDAHDGLASTLFLLDDAEGAAVHFTEAIRLDPRRAGAHINLGAALSRLGQHARAIQAIRQGIELDPHRAEGFYNLGLSYRAGGDYEQAGAALEKATRLDPTLVGAHFNLGGLLLAQGQTERAAACFRKALELDPSCDDAAEALAHAEMVLGGLRSPVQGPAEAPIRRPPAPVAARPALRAAAFADVAPRGPAFGDTSLERCEPLDSHWSLPAPKVAPVPAQAPSPPLSFDDLLREAGAALGEGRVEEAHARYEKARLQRPDSSDAHYGLAAAKFLLNDAEGAAVHFELVTRLEPRRAAAFVNLGAALSKLGDHRQAAQVIRKGIELAPRFAEAYCNLGLVCRAAGDDGERAGLAEAVSLDPQLTDAHLNLGHLHLPRATPVPRPHAIARCWVGAIVGGGCRGAGRWKPCLAVWGLPPRRRANPTPSSLCRPPRRRPTAGPRCETSTPRFTTPMTRWTRSGSIPKPAGRRWSS